MKSPVQQRAMLFCLVLTILLCAVPSRAYSEEASINPCESSGNELSQALQPAAETSATKASVTNGANANASEETPLNEPGPAKTPSANGEDPLGTPDLVDGTLLDEAPPTTPQPEATSTSDEASLQEPPSSAVQHDVPSGSEQTLNDPASSEGQTAEDHTNETPGTQTPGTEVPKAHAPGTQAPTTEVTAADGKTPAPAAQTTEPSLGTQATQVSSTNNVSQVACASSTKTASVTPSLRIEATATYNSGTSKSRIKKVSVLVASEDGSATVVIYGSKIKGKTYVFLPSCTNRRRVQLGWVCSEGTQAYVASRQKGRYVAIDQFGRLNLKKGFKRDTAGAYLVWLRAGTKGKKTCVRVMISAGIRSVYLTSDDPVGHGRSWVEASREHENKTTGKMLLLTADGRVVYDGALTQIKGRGNSTWWQDKKPYQIKLDKKASLLDGTDANKAKTWVLLANSLDSSMEREYLARKLALKLGLKNTPDAEYADLYYDGVYRGTYLLGEKVQVGKGRVDIYDLEEANEKLNGDTSKLKTKEAKNSFGQRFSYVKGMKDPADISGGYIVELDHGYWKNERCWFQTTVGYFAVKAPEDCSLKQMRYISEYVQRCINEGRKPNGDLARYVDLTSLAKVTLVNEAAKNPDWLKYSSTFFYKDAGSKSLLQAGPIWDFDLAFGVARQDDEAEKSYMSATGLVNDWSGFFSKNKQYKKEFKKVYQRGAASIRSLVRGGSTKKGLVGDTAKDIKASWDMNRTIWPYKATEYVPLNLSNRSDSLTYLWNWTAARVNWLARAVGGLKKPVVSIPRAIKNGVYKVTSGVGKVLNCTGSNVDTWSWHGGKNQKYRFRAVGRSTTGEWYYSIQSVGTGRVLQAEGGGTSPTTNVNLGTYRKKASQHWIVRATSRNSSARFQIINVASGLALDLGGGEKRNGANVLLYLICGNNRAQNWTLKRVK